MSAVAPHPRRMPSMRPSRFLLAGVALALFGACSSKADRIESGLEKGANFVRLADWDKAHVEVRNVLQIDPKNAQAYFLAGQIAEARQDIRRAFGSFSKAVELAPDHLEARVAIARVYLLAGDDAKSRQAVDDALAVAPGHVGARTIQAALMARGNDVPGAIALARSLLDAQGLAPVETSMLLAGLYAGQGRTAEALATVDAALQRAPDSLSLLQVAAQIAGESPDGAGKAVDYLRRATEVAPKNTSLWTAWAVHHTRRGELDPAEAVLRKAVAAQPADSERTLVLLDFLATRRGVAAAEKEFLAAIADKPRDASLRFGLERLYRTSGRSSDARRVLQEIIDGGPDTPSGLTARNRLATDLLVHGRAAEARALVEAVLATSPRDGAALVTRGRLWLADGDARSAVIDLRAAAKDQPGSAEVAGLLAQAHRRAGEPELAREVLAEAAKNQPDSAELRLLLAADMADAKDYRAAAAEIERAIKAAPQDLRSYDMKVKLALAQGDEAGAEQTLVALKTQFPGSPTGALRLGQFYAERKRFDAALKEYDAAAGIAGGSTEPLLRAVGVLIAQRRFDAADARIDALAKRDPRSALAQQLRGDIELARGDVAGAEQAYRKLIELAPSTPVGYHSLARLKLLRNDLAQALAALEQGEKASPGDLSLAATRAEWLSRAGRADEAIAVYQTLVDRAPDQDAYANNLAYLLAERKGDAASLQRALALTQRFRGSSNAGYLDSLGWIHYRLGQYAEAVTVLERAVQQAPDAALQQLHLGMALHKSGDTARAQPHLKKALERPGTLPGVDEAKRMLAQG